MIYYSPEVLKVLEANTSFSETRKARDRAVSRGRHIMTNPEQYSFGFESGQLVIRRKEFHANTD